MCTSPANQADALLQRLVHWNVCSVVGVKYRWHSLDHDVHGFKGLSAQRRLYEARPLPSQHHLGAGLRLDVHQVRALPAKNKLFMLFILLHCSHQLSTCLLLNLHVHQVWNVPAKTVSFQYLYKPNQYFLVAASASNVFAVNVHFIIPA